MTWRFLFCALLLATPPLGSTAAQAHCPERPVDIRAGVASRVALDVRARSVGDKHAAAPDSQMVIEDTAAAGGHISQDRAAKISPNGFSPAVCGNGSLVVASRADDRRPCGQAKEFLPITRVLVAADTLVARPDAPPKRLAELIVPARAYPGKLTHRLTDKD
jgi:tripartite-type tricarboxylate transporter receptor subunit TctC